MIPKQPALIFYINLKLPHGVQTVFQTASQKMLLIHLTSWLQAYEFWEIFNIVWIHFAYNAADAMAKESLSAAWHSLMHCTSCCQPPAHLCRRKPILIRTLLGRFLSKVDSWKMVECWNSRLREHRRGGFKDSLWRLCYEFQRHLLSAYKYILLPPRWHY